ncbi:hypothetical protein EI94DRAFT_1749627 [Lactarius quietus]|nr:hypothetical protein EI94DRAFT_1749627 [Lactarius quietus]
MPFSHDDELTTPIYHRVRIDAIDRGSSRAPVPSHVGYLCLTFSESLAPYLFVETTRVYVMVETVRVSERDRL